MIKINGSRILGQDGPHYARTHGVISMRFELISSGIDHDIHIVSAKWASSVKQASQWCNFRFIFDQPPYRFKINGHARDSASARSKCSLLALRTASIHPSAKWHCQMSMPLIPINQQCSIITDFIKYHMVFKQQHEPSLARSASAKKQILTLLYTNIIIETVSRPHCCSKMALRWD